MDNFMRQFGSNHATPALNLSLTDYFLHSSFLNNADAIHHARILIAMLYGFICISAIPLLLLLVTATAPDSRLIGIPANATLIAIFTWLLFRLKNSGAYDFCCNAVIVVLLLFIASGTLISGGINSSPFAQLLVVPPLMAFFFGSVRGGITTTVATTAATILIVTLENSGIALPKLLNPEHVPMAQSLTLLVEFFLVTTLAHIYEHTSASLRIERDIDYQNIVRLSQTDQLTGLANRRAFDDAISQRIAHYSAKQPVRSFALCYLDLDGFKPINDRHGHDTGDQVLRAVSIRLRSALRGTDLIGRHGGDEFMLLLDEIGSATAAEAMAKRFIQLIGEPIETSAGLVMIRGSFGFAIFPTHATDTELLKKSADTAMYEAKRNHLGWKIFDSENSCPRH